MYTSPTDEDSLVNLDQLQHTGCYSKSESLGEHLPNGMYQADQTIVPEAFRTLRLVDEHHNSLIEVVEAVEVEVPK